MAEDRFTKMFTYFDKRLDDVETRFNGLDTKFDQLFGFLDGYTKKFLDLEQEHLMLSRKVDRHEGWNKKTAKKLGIKLRY